MRSGVPLKDWKLKAAIWSLSLGHINKLYRQEQSLLETIKVSATSFSLMSIRKGFFFRRTFGCLTVEWFARSYLKTFQLVFAALL